MAINVGGMDRILRIAIGAILMVLAATSVIGWWGWLGILPLATGLTRRCPPYSLLGSSTCKTSK